MALRKKKTLLDQAQDYVEAVRPHVESAVTTTREAVEDFVENTPARHPRRPRQGGARARRRPRPGRRRRGRPCQGRTGTIKDARAKAAPARGRRRRPRAARPRPRPRRPADARVATLRGEEPPKKGGKLKKFALFAAVAGAVASSPRSSRAAARRPTTGSRPTCPSPLRPRPAPKDTAARHPTRRSPTRPTSRTPLTTPDQPAEVVDLEEAVEKPVKKTAKKAATDS